MEMRRKHIVDWSRLVLSGPVSTEFALKPA
jgi:hypothetical protein